MTIEEMLRRGEVRTADNGLVYAVIPEAGASAAHSAVGDERGLEKMVGAVPRGLAPRLGRAATYFVPWLYKQKRSVLVGTEAAAEGENRKEMCHHLDVKPGGSLLLISLRFYEHDSYGLAMEFFDKIAYVAALEPSERDDFEQVVRKQLQEGKAGELTAETWEWRAGLAEAEAGAQAAKGRKEAAEAWDNYRRAAETDALGLYMASLYTDIFYEDLFEEEPGFPALLPDLVYDRVRAAERAYPPNRGYSFQVVRQRPRRRRPAGAPAR